MEAEKYTVEFIGPFSWLGETDAPSLFENAVAKKSGIYLWTIETNSGFLIYYVGQTGRTFYQRMKEHFKEHLAGFYHLNDPDEFRNGKRVSLWGGIYNPKNKISLSLLGEKHPELSGLINQLAHQYRFFFASMDNSTRIIERIESSLANHLYKQEGIIGDFQEKGIRYRPRWDNEIPINTLFVTKNNLIGLPTELEA